LAVRVRFLVLALACLLVATAPSRAAPERTLTIGITQFPHTLHPSVDSMAATTYILGMARRPITAYDADWELTCRLCTALPTLDNGLAVVEPVPPDIGDGSGKGMAVTYTLPAAAVWGDGTPITSADVRFTWEVGKHPKTGITAAEGYRRIRDVEIIDDKTFVLHQDRISFAYNAINDLRLLPAHLERAAFETDPARYREQSTFERDPTNPGLYFGPYVVASVTTGSQVTLTRNPRWWGKRPFFDRIVVKAVENTAALEANLLSGGLDAIAGELGLAVDQAIAFEARHGNAYKVLYQPALFYEHLDVNLDNPVLADVRVRRALLHAIDRQAISDRLFGGKVPVALTSVSPLDRVYTEDVPRYPYDPETAQRLLSEAGWTPGPDGIRVKDGHRLAFDLQTTAGDRSRERVEQVLQAQWRAVGAEARIRNEPARTLFAETLSKRKFKGLVQFAWISSPENPPRSTLHCDQIPSADNAWTGQNYTGYCNPEVDALLEAINSELDPDTRTTLWADLQKIYARDLPALPLYFRAEAHVLPKWLEGVRPTGHLNYSTLWVEDWRDRRAGGT